MKEKQSKAIDDVTFGLKNKNKSKKVQQFISRVEKAVKYNPDAVSVYQIQWTSIINKPIFLSNHNGYYVNSQKRRKPKKLKNWPNNFKKKN